MFEVSPQIKDYWPRRNGAVINSKSANNNVADSSRPKHIVEENGDKPLYYQKEAARTKVSKL